MPRPRSAPQDSPAHDPLAEQAVLGTFMQDPDSLDDPRCALIDDDFYFDRNKLIYRAVRSVYARGDAVDMVTVADELARTGTLGDAGGLVYLDELLAAVPSLGRGAEYAAIVRRHALERHLRWRLKELPEPDAGADSTDLVTEAVAAVKAQFPPLGAGACDRIVVRLLADVAPADVDWLWPGRIALGKITLGAGLPGLGKSYFTVDVSARTTVGRPWPDGRGAPPRGDVVILNAEDDAGDTIRPRFDAAGGDPSRVHVLEAVRGPDGKERGFDLATDLDRLRALLRRLPAPKLVIIDPVNAYLGRADSHKEAAVRGVLAPLGRLAAEFGVAVVLVSHLNKSSGVGAMGRVTGAMAFVGAARAAWLISDDPAGRSEDADDGAKARRLMLPLKNNLAPDTGGLAYAVGGDPACVIWEPDPVFMTADEALAPRPADGAETQESPCVTWLRETLEAAGGRMSSADLTEAGEEAGYSESQVRRAKPKLRVRSEKAGFGGGWQCVLPPAPAEDAEGAAPRGPDAFDAFGDFGREPDLRLPPHDPFGGDGPSPPG